MHPHAASTGSRSPSAIASSCSGLRQFTVGNEPITPLRQAATTSSTPETRNIGAAISGRLRRSRKRARRSIVGKVLLPGLSRLLVVLAFIEHWHGRRPITKQAGEERMSNPLYAFPAVMRADVAGAGALPGADGVQLAGRIDHLSGRDRHDRAHAEPSSCSWALQPGTRVAFLTANRADTWCAGVAAQLSRLAITWLHPLGSLDDQLFQLEDSEAQMLVVDGVTFRDRGGELAAQGLGPENRLHARPGRLRRRPAAGDRGGRQRHRAQFRRPGRYRHAELHRRHHRQIQGRAAPSPRA